MTSLVHLAYASHATEELSAAALRTLLGDCRRNNAAVDVTGILLFVDGSFFQILEGAPENVETLYDKISRDRRHARVSKVILEPIARRDFREWSMGLARVSARELAGVPGLSDFFASRKTLDALDEGLARRLLQQFRDGRWRARVGE